MATELRPGIFTELMDRIAAEGVRRAGATLAQVTIAVEGLAKVEVSHGAHPYGTPTPATPGAGPAVISGTLRRSITHTPPKFAGDAWTSFVFPAPGFHPPYGRGKGRADSAKYGYYLETGDHGITYPWLKPAADQARPAVPGLFRAAFSFAWPMFA